MLPSASASDWPQLLFVGFALAQGTASMLFAALVLGMARRTRRRRPALPFFAVGFLCPAIGVGMGAVTAAVPGTNLRTSSIHTWISLLGFAGFVIFGMTHEILPPYPRRGRATWEIVTRGHAGLATLGLLLVVLSQVLALAGFPRSSAVIGISGFGLLLGMALSYAAGTIQTLRAISPPPEAASSEG